MTNAEHDDASNASTTSPSPSPGGICLFGAAMDTANLGVSALAYSVVSALAEGGDGRRITVFDHSRGLRVHEQTINGLRIPLARCGAYLTKRFYRPESLWNIRVCARLGGLGNPAARAMRDAAAILDISGGDSFTDLYGPNRFRAITLPKLMAMELGKPLILLPQTYGPFEDPKFKAIARRIVRQATMAWARDARSLEVLRDLLGDAFDSERHRLGVDVAFMLPTREPSAEVVEPIRPWLEDGATPLAGINVSGLLMNRPGIAHSQYGFKADYQKVVEGLVRRFLRETDARVLLVPHVVSPPGHYESDIEACEAIARTVAPEADGRVMVCPALDDPTQIKWVIARCGWFCGTRMHSTIAALSSGVPTAAIAYSPKTLGVFESCGQGGHVADPRTLDTEAVLEHLWDSYGRRTDAAEALATHLPEVKGRATGQMQEIMASWMGGEGGPSTGAPRAGAPRA